MLPDFLIIGTQRGGTTSLYNYLVEHPRVVAARQKEVQFFSVNYGRGLDWYETNFTRTHGLRRRITGEASPYYLFHPQAAERAHAACPHAKLVALLRDPVERAYSQYRLESRKGAEVLSFEEALDAEEARLAGDREGYAHRHHSYAARGRYIEHLPAWLDRYAAAQILILRSEDLFAEPGRIYIQTLEFLGLKPHKLSSFEPYNASAEAEGLHPDTRRRLVDHFRSYNKRLYEFLGRDFGWQNVS